MNDKNVLAAQIKEYICNYYAISSQELDSGSQWFPDIEARYIAFFMLHKYVYNDVPNCYRLIGRQFNRHDRNTVRHGLKKLNEWKSVDKRVQKYFSDIKIFVESNILNYENFNS